MDNKQVIWDDIKRRLPAAKARMSDKKEYLNPWATRYHEDVSFLVDEHAKLQSQCEELRRALQAILAYPNVSTYRHDSQLIAREALLKAKKERE